MPDSDPPYEVIPEILSSVEPYKDFTTPALTKSLNFTEDSLR